MPVLRGGFVRFDEGSDAGSTTKGQRAKSDPRVRDPSAFPLLTFEDSNGVSPANSERRWEVIEKQASEDSSEWPIHTKSNPTEWPPVQTNPGNNDSNMQRQIDEKPKQTLKPIPTQPRNGLPHPERRSRKRAEDNLVAAPKKNIQSFDPFDEPLSNDNTPWFPEPHNHEQPDRSINNRRSNWSDLSASQNHQSHDRDRNDVHESFGNWPHNGGYSERLPHQDDDKVNSPPTAHTQQGLRKQEKLVHGDERGLGSIRKNQGRVTSRGCPSPHLVATKSWDSADEGPRAKYTERAQMHGRERSLTLEDYRTSQSLGLYDKLDGKGMKSKSMHLGVNKIPSDLEAQTLSTMPTSSREWCDTVTSELSSPSAQESPRRESLTNDSIQPRNAENYRETRPDRTELPKYSRKNTHPMPSFTSEYNDAEYGRSEVASDVSEKSDRDWYSLQGQVPSKGGSNRRPQYGVTLTQEERRLLESTSSFRYQLPSGMHEYGVMGDIPRDTHRTEGRRKTIERSDPTIVRPRYTTERRRKSSESYGSERKARQAGEIEISESNSFPDRESPTQFLKERKLMDIREGQCDDGIFLSFQPTIRGGATETLIQYQKAETTRVLSELAGTRMRYGESKRNSSNDLFHGEPLSGMHHRELLSPLNLSKTPCGAKSPYMEAERPSHFSKTPREAKSPYVEAERLRSPGAPALDLRTSTPTDSTRNHQESNQQPPAPPLKSPGTHVKRKEASLLQKFVKMAAPIIQQGAISMAQEEPIRRAAERLGIPLMEIDKQSEVAELSVNLVEIPNSDIGPFSASIREAAKKFKALEVTTISTPNGAVKRSSGLDTVVESPCTHGSSMPPIEAMESLLDTSSDIEEEMSSASQTNEVGNEMTLAEHNAHMQSIEVEPLAKTSGNTPPKANNIIQSSAIPKGSRESNLPVKKGASLPPAYPSNTNTKKQSESGQAQVTRQKGIEATRTAVHGNSEQKLPYKSTVDPEEVKIVNDATQLQDLVGKRDATMAYSSKAPINKEGGNESVQIELQETRSSDTNDTPLGATIEEIDLLNKFLAIVGPNFSDHVLSIVERERVHDEALRAGIPERFLNQILDQSAGIRRWEEKSVCSDESNSAKMTQRSRRRRRTEPCASGASACTGESLRTKSTYSSDGSYTTGRTRSTGLSSSSYYTHDDTYIASPSEVEWGCGCQVKNHFWPGSNIGQASENVILTVGAVLSGDSESVHTDDGSWQTEQ